MSRFPRTVALGVCILTATAQAKFIELSTPDEWPIPKRPGATADFVAPNEHSPATMRDLLARAPEGVHISVGTERGFIGAALNPGATHLLLLDVSERAVLFNRINIGLLQIARSREDYLGLRLSASHQDILSRLKDSRYLEPEFRRVLSKPENWSNWRKSLNQSAFDFLHAPPAGASVLDFAFKDANYLHYDKQFEKISSMAKAGKIEAQLFDLGSVRDAQRLTDDILRKGLRVSAADISNAWPTLYSNRLALEDTFRELSHAASPDSVFIFTAAGGGARDPRFDAARRRIFNKWSYIAFSNSKMSRTLKTPGGFQRELNGISKTVRSGRLAYLDETGAVPEPVMDDEVTRPHVSIPMDNPCRARLIRSLKTLLGRPR